MLPTSNGMNFKWFSRNGKILPVAEAVVPLSNIEYSYGFGVYETIRVQNGKPRFLEDHLERLVESAAIINLEHIFTPKGIDVAVRELVAKNAADICNLKILLIGAKSPKGAELYIQCLKPLFPDKKLYIEGAHVITYEYERPFPHAKTLNMLQSYLAYRKAKAADAYDALLINQKGCITEGTRTNFFTIRNRIIYSPPESEILSGVTRKYVLQVALQNGFTVAERDIKLTDISVYDGAFVTSTSSKIIPIRSVDTHAFNKEWHQLKILVSAFNNFLQMNTG